ncbi:MAG: glutathione S-transferase [Bdellovibrionaceae bacterium]|nr:glutathione S-transferase [Pseudobdellovibrionaceae bacterium]
MKNETVEFYTNPQSRSRIVRWMLEELDIPYEVKVVAYGKEMKSEPYLSINPMGKVPTIIHKRKVITECAAICAYLADAFPEKKLAPSIDQRSAYYRWMFFAAGPLESAVTNRTLGFEVPSNKEAVAGYGNFETTINTLCKAVTESPFIAGDSFSAADVYVGSHIGWGLEFGTIPKHTELSEYFDKLKNREAYLKAKHLDDTLAQSIESEKKD